MIWQMFLTAQILSLHKKRECQRILSARIALRFLLMPHYFFAFSGFICRECQRILSARIALRFLLMPTIFLRFWDSYVENASAFSLSTTTFCVVSYSSILPSVEIVTTCHGMNLPLACSAVFAACSKPPQHGTSMRTTVTLFISLSAIMAVSFSL